MKISRLFNSLPKRMTATAIVLLAAAFPAASLAAQTVKLESSLGVANVTAGDTTYKQAINASYDQVVKLQVYYHNQENPDSGKIAQNLRVKITIPTTPSKAQTVSSTVSADNANTVNSSATINLDGSDAYLQYIPGSAVWKHNVGTNDNVTWQEDKISDNVVLGGQGLVLENEKPCFNYAATVTVLARVMVPGVKVVKQVEKANETNAWKQNNTANPGDTLKYLITYQNTGNTVQKQVIIRDNLPPHMTLVPGTTYLATATNPNGVKVGDTVTQGGINAGNFGAGANAFVTFQVKIDDADKLAEGENIFRNVGVAHPEGMQEYYNIAVTTVTKTSPAAPRYTCDLLDVTQGPNRTVTISDFKYTATNGATFKNAVISWGDSAASLTTDAPKGKTHQYAQDGTYTISAVAHFTANGKDVTATGNCTKQVSFSTPAAPTTPATPTELPNTGAGDVLGLFAGVTAAGAFAHRFVSRRLAQRS